MTSGPGTLRVAAAQAESVPGDLAANVATAVPLVEQAAERGARVVVLPELFLTGYAPEAWKPDLCLTLEEPELEEPELEPLRSVARERGIVVLAGAGVRRPAGCTLSVVMVDPSGSVTAPYDKQHVDSDESWYGSTTVSTRSTAPRAALSRLSLPFE